MLFRPEPSDGWHGIDNPASVPKSPSEYEFDRILFDREMNPKVSIYHQFMRRWHYSESAEVSPKYLFGIWYDGRIQGMLMYGKPAMNQIYKQYSDNPDGIIELRRMVLIDKTPANTESWLIGKSLKWLAKNTNETIVVTYADPIHGHTGIAYKACNFIYDGLSGNAPAIMLEDGTIVHDRLLRMKDKKGSLSSRAKELRQLLASGKAWRIEQPKKHRYHFHLKNKVVECKLCDAKVTPNELFAKIEKAWSKETSFLPETWTYDNRAVGQCAVSSLVIQERLGGDLMKCEIEGKDYTHYYNVLPDGNVIDLTRKQFGHNVKFTKPVKRRANDILQYKSVSKRYQLLKQNMALA